MCAGPAELLDSVEGLSLRVVQTFRTPHDAGQFNQKSDLSGRACNSGVVGEYSIVINVTEASIIVGTMTQVAQVKKKFIFNGTARVAVFRKGACSHDCSKCGAAPHGGSSLRDGRSVNRWAPIVVDTVLVESDSAPVIGLAAIMYLLPMSLLCSLCNGQLLHLSELGSIARPPWPCFL
jgi:sigma-E factor negative regulatory protein RseC